MLIHQKLTVERKHTESCLAIDEILCNKKTNYKY